MKEEEWGVKEEEVGCEGGGIREMEQCNNMQLSVAHSISRERSQHDWTNTFEQCLWTFVFHLMSRRRGGGEEGGEEEGGEEGGEEEGGEEEGGEE